MYICWWGEPVYVKRNKTVVITQLDGTVSVSAVLVNDTGDAKTQHLSWRIYDAKGVEIA